jgi:transcriptional regulator with XRE-family HTH domain
MRSSAIRIRKSRREKGLSQAQLADRLRVSRSAVSQWERTDGCAPSASNLERLATVLDCTFEWLATGRGRQRPGDAHDGSDAVVLRHFARDDDEEHLLEGFRALDVRDRRTVLTLIGSFQDAKTAKDRR